MYWHQLVAKMHTWILRFHEWLIWTIQLHGIGWYDRSQYFPHIVVLLCIYIGPYCVHSPSEVTSVLTKSVRIICSKFTGEHPCQSGIPIKLQRKATLLKSHFSMGVLLYICRIFLERLFLSLSNLILPLIY